MPADRCKNCDKPIASQSDFDTISDGGGEDLCWRLFNGGGAGGTCNQAGIDWYTRCLAAEQVLRDILCEYHDGGNWRWVADRAAAVLAVPTVSATPKERP